MAIRVRRREERRDDALGMPLVTAALPAGLESTESIFRALAAHTPLGIFVSALDGRCVYVNARWCELTGLGIDDALGDGWSSAIHPDDFERVSGEWADASRNERDSVVEYRFVRPDGGVSWIQGFATALRDDSGQVAGWVGSCLDLTASKRAEASAEQSGKRFEAAFDSAPIGVSLTGPDGAWIDVNDVLCSITGYTKSELMALTFADITHPDDREASQADWLRHQAGTDKGRIEKRYIRADGTIIWVCVSRTSVRDDAGRHLYTVAHIEDITERRAAQRSLEEAEERFRRAFDDAPIGMALVGLDGRCLRTNTSLCTILGYSTSELLELRFQDLTHADDLERSNESARGLVAGEYPSFAHDSRYIRKNGDVVWTTLSVSLVRDHAEQPSYFVAQIIDIHDRKLAEAETARLLELEREHVDRLRALDGLKDEFVASVSHELRTPLTSIKGYLELVLDGEAGELNDEQHGYLTTVDRNSERLLRLVGDLLFVGQSEAGKFELELDDADLGVIVRECVESAEPAAAAKEIRVDLRAGEIPSFRGDRARLAQLLDNLVSNAIKFTPHGGKVTVSVEHVADAARIEVRDTGIGIPLDEQRQLFDRFFRARAATEGAIQGTGLGLSIAKTIAEGHGGSLGVESEVGVGTVFRVEIPLTRA